MKRGVPSAARVGRVGLVALALLLVSASPADELAKGQSALDSGDVAGAIVHFSLAVKAARDAKDPAAEVEAELRLATADRAVGKLEDADQWLDAAASAALGTGDPRDPARIATARGLLQLDQGDVRKAEKTLKDAFAAHQAAKDPQGAANAAVDLGLARMALGRDADADAAFAAAGTLFAALKDDRGRADALVDRGIVARRQGRLQAAKDAYSAAIALYRSAGDGGTGEADALADLGLVLEDLGAPDDARKSLETALATARQRKDVPRQATLLLDLGALEHREGHLDAAKADYDAAEQAWTSIGREADAASAALDRALLSPDVASFQALADRARKSGDRRLEAVASLDLAALLAPTDPKAAAKPLQRAKDLSDVLALSDVHWRALYLSGKLALAAGKESGLDDLRAAVDELERSRTSLDAETSARFVTGHEDVYRALVDALLARQRTAEAFAYAQRLQLADLPAPPVPADDAAAQKLESLQAEQAYVADALSDELSRRPDGEDTEKAAALRQQLAQLRVEFAKTVDELRATYPDFDELVRVDPEDLEAIQGDLDPGVAVLQPILFPDRLVLLVFRKDRIVARTVAVDQATVEKAVGGLVRSLRSQDVYDPERTKRACDQLGGWLLDPVAGDLDGAGTLVVSASGAFRQLPFAALRHGGRWEVEERAVVDVTTVGSLRRRSAVDAGFRLDGPGLLLLGDPDGSLPGAEQEVEAIAKRFPGATVLTGGAGTREALYGDMGGKRALHLATHGVIDPSHPDRSYLVVAGADGKLAYGDIPGLAPYLGSCRLVVLSACESGLPVDAPPPKDGEVLVSIAGLAAQFRRAGVETLVASLWRVDDEATLGLMDGFYADLAKGKDVATSLRDAQLAMLKDPKTAHPWYWGAFVIVGDWR